MRKNLILVLIISLGIFLRVYQIDQFPVHLGHDEITQLYDAISIAETGKDIYGSSWPFIFQSVNDYKPPFYTYSTALVYKIIGDHEALTIRLTGVVFGILMIWAVYLFTLEFIKKRNIALVAALFTAIAPFEIFYSRKSFENGTGLFLVLIGFTLIHRFLSTQNMRWLYFGVLALCAAMYTYFSHTVIIPILIIGFTIIFWKQIFAPNFRQKIVHLIGPIIFGVVLLVPLVSLIFLNQNSFNRSNAVFITQDSQYHQILVSGDLYGVINYPLTRFLEQFSPKYLFGDGLDLTDKILDSGPLMAAQFPLILLGIFYLVRSQNDRRNKYFLAAWVVIGMIPSALTFEAFSPHRSIMVFTMLNLISAVGLLYLWQKLSALRINRYNIFRIALVVLIGINLLYFLNLYTTAFPTDRSEAIHYPYKEVSHQVWSEYENYDQIIFDSKFGRNAPHYGAGVWYYLAYYGRVAPAQMQQQFKRNDNGEVTFGKFVIRNINYGEDHDLKNTLLVASPWSIEMDESKKPFLLKTIYFYDKKIPAYYFIKTQ